MRPPAIEKMGYYPTDDPVVEIIRTYLKPPTEKGRLFDPCAGEGKAASTLGNALNCETWGVELSPERAEKAQSVMDKVYQAPWQACVLSDESVSWLYLNPPYAPSVSPKGMSLIVLMTKNGWNGIFSKPRLPN